MLLFQTLATLLGMAAVSVQASRWQFVGHNGTDCRQRVLTNLHGGSGATGCQGIEPTSSIEIYRSEAPCTLYFFPEESCDFGSAYIMYTTRYAHCINVFQDGYGPLHNWVAYQVYCNNRQATTAADKGSDTEPGSDIEPGPAHRNW